MSEGSNFEEWTAIISNWALLYTDWGRYEDAEPLLRQLLIAYQHRFGQQDIRVAIVMHCLSVALGNMGRRAESQQMEQEAESIRDRLKTGAHN